jgi:hypothetical protein
MTRRSEKNDIFWTSEWGNSFREYFKNKPGNLFSNFDILLGTSQRTIYMKFKKIHRLVFFAHSVLLYLKDRPFNIGGEGGIFLQFFPTQKKIILFWGKRKFTKKEKM